MEDVLFKTMTQSVAYDGQPAKLVKLQNNNGMSVTLMDIGATWLSCIVPVKGEFREVLLGISTMDDFNKQSTYLGATVGRYANRIASGKFEIEGQTYQLKTNQAGNTLHGGPDGFDKRRWEIALQDKNTVIFSLFSDDGDQGFPGDLKVTVCYCLTDDNQVEIRYNARTNKATPINLSNHAYFNLSGTESGLDCKNHMLRINADSYLPTNEDGIPFDEPVAVGESSFNFCLPKKITQDFLRDSQQKHAKGYDHSFLLNNNCSSGECAAEVSAVDDSITLKMFTDKPAIQLYTGNWLEGTPNREGGEYKDYAGIALEAQFLPDSPNHPEWNQPSSIINAGEEYAYKTSYQFIASNI